MLKTSLDRLRVVGMMEGASFLLLLGVAMPLKYLAGMPQMVRVVGMLHGILFLLYVAAVFQVSVELRWPLRRIVAALAASVLPFGPFVFDAHLRRVQTLESRAFCVSNKPRPGVCWTGLSACRHAGQITVGSVHVTGAAPRPLAW